MKLSCHIIEDLLPLYHDNVCSQESRDLVEVHLKECEACRELISSLNDETERSEINIDDALPLKAIGTAWKKDKKKAFIKGTAIAVIICAMLIGGFIGLTQWKCIPVSADLLGVTEVSQLSDGRIIYHLNVKDNRDLHFVKFTTLPDGSYYMTPMRSVIEGKRVMKSGLYNDYFMVDIAENNAYQKSHGDGIMMTSCYVGPRDKGILIWKEGMMLPKASAALEQMVSTGIY